MSRGRSGLHWLHRCEDLLLALALLSLVLLASAQILLRMAFDTGLIWLDPLLRNLVLWVALLGAMVAAREGRHIGLDLFNRVLPVRTLRVLRGVAFVFAAAISALLAWHAGRMVRDEFEFGGIAFGAVPIWAVQVILPVALAVIAVRLVITAFKPPPAPATLIDPEPTA